MQNILADLTHHAERFQVHADTAKSSEASQQDKEDAFFLAQVQFAGIQQKFSEIVHHVDLEITEILKSFGIDWIKKNTKPEEKKEYVDTPATPETSEPVQAVPQPQFLGDVPTQVEVQEATPTTQEQEVQQTTL